MKTIALSLFGIAAIGCSDEADIGVDSAPITCGSEALAEVDGNVDLDGTTYDFNVASPSVDVLSPNLTSLSLVGPDDQGLDTGSLLLRFHFSCGMPEIATYGINSRSDQITCPYQVGSSIISGRQTNLQATDGVLHVDQNSNCLAGRFRVDFGDSGSVGGWFSTPWQ